MKKRNPVVLLPLISLMALAVNAGGVDASETLIINDSNAGTTVNHFNYAGGWKTSTGTGKYLGDDHYSATAGTSFTVTFRGTQISLHGATAPRHGLAAVSIDEAPASTVDFYSPSRVEDKLVYTSPILGDALHTLKVTVTGTRRAGSKGNIVTADRVIIAQSTSTPTTTVTSTATATASPTPTATTVTETAQGVFTRVGTKLMLNGKQYKFAGLNADTWFGCWPDEVSTDTQLDRYFRELNPRSMTRLFAFSRSKPGDHGSHRGGGGAAWAVFGAESGRGQR